MSTSSSEGGQWGVGRYVMALSEFEEARIDKLVGDFVEKHRPSPEIRDQLDIAYRVDGQSVEIFEVRPHWQDPSIIMEQAVAKMTYVKSQNIWKLFWQRADLKWHGYEPFPKAKRLEDCLNVIAEDQYACFWG